MLHVELENILSEAEATTQIGNLISKVDGSDQIVVITRDNRPAVALVAVSQLEGLTGREVRPAAPLVPTPVEAAAMDTSLSTPFATSMAQLAPELPSLPDFPGDDMLEDTPAAPAAAAPQMPSQTGLNSFTPGVPSMPSMPVLPQVPNMPVPPAIPTMSGTPAPTPAAPMQAPDGLPDFARRQESGLPPEDLSSSSPLA